MRIAFRTDASVTIGAGHVMRCLTLADALRAYGASCTFVCRPHPGHLLALIRERGFATRTLGATEHDRSPASGPAHAAWLGASWQTDAAQTIAQLDRTDLLVVDHYGIDHRWEQQARSAARKIMVLDDLADRAHDCDVLLDQNLGRDPADYGGCVPAGCTILAGSAYALLRPDFGRCRESSLLRRTSAPPREILIAMGGMDNNNVTTEVLGALQGADLAEGTCLTVLLGDQAPWVADVRAVAARMPWPTEVQVGVREMAAVMSQADIAIGAAGSSSWERCALGVPTIMLVLADNQRRVAEELAGVGAAVLLREDWRTRLASAATALLRNRTARHHMSLQAAAVCDGRGAERVLAQLCRPG